ncbi:protein-methionine-sulfoxide reductase catalytic subunit MsrP [Alsobacter sp. R-9]
MPTFRPAPIRPSEITPKEVWLNRRDVVRGAMAAAAAAGVPWAAQAAGEPALQKLDAPRNPAFAVKDELTPKKLVTTYNNFYEFGTGKSDPAENAGALRVRPWTVEIAGAVEKPMTLGIEEILKFPLEERVYRFRCVEAWSMVVPWVGFEFNKLAARVNPTSKAKFVKFITAEQKDTMTGLRFPYIDFPYVEGLRIDEAMHPLTLMTVGLYGETLPNQNGAPIRLIAPWKYGFKSGKSIVRIEFVEQEPKTTWMLAGPSEYGFYSNVNPAVDHPRWSQKRERVLPGLFASRQTEPFNGYAEQVASLYAGMDLKTYF